MDIPKEVRQQIETSMYRYAQVKQAAKEAEEQKKDIKEEILPLMVAYSLKDYTLKGLGKLVQKQSSGASIKAEKLRIALLNRGVVIQVIDACIEEASTSWSTPYIDFIAER